MPETNWLITYKEFDMKFMLCSFLLLWSSILWADPKIIISHALTKIGESFLVRVGVTSDISRDNLGFVFGIEPRFHAW